MLEARSPRLAEIGWQGCAASLARLRMEAHDSVRSTAVPNRATMTPPSGRVHVLYYIMRGDPPRPQFSRQIKAGFPFRPFSLNESTSRHLSHHRQPYHLRSACHTRATCPPSLPLTLGVVERRAEDTDDFKVEWAGLDVGRTVWKCSS